MTNEVQIPLPYRELDGSILPLEGVESIFLTGSTIEICALNEIVGADQTAALSKETLLQDIQFRGAISDFHPIKSKITNANYDPLLIRYNLEDLYGDGNNFELACTKEAADRWTLISKLKEEKRQKEEDASAAEEALLSVPRYQRQMIINPWKSMGSEAEVLEEKVEDKEEPVINLRKLLKDLRRPLKLQESPPSVICDKEERDSDSRLKLERTLRSLGVQAVPLTTDSSTQASGQRSVREFTQYSPLDMSEEEKNSIFYTEPMAQFLQRTYAKLEDVFLEYEVTDILENDFDDLSEEAVNYVENREANLKEVQSFTHLLYSKSKIVTCIEWSPFRKGVVSASYLEPVSLEERSASCGCPKEYAILEWSSTNPMAPQRILLAPSEITIFQYNPLDPTLIAGGTFSGQVLLWTIEDETDNKQTPQTIRSSHKSCIEAVENSPIADLKWLPEIELNKNRSVSNLPDKCCMFLTCSIDGRLVFWDTRLEKTLKRVTASLVSYSLNCGCQGQSLDKVDKLNFRPVYSVPLFGLEHSDLSPRRIKFCRNSTRFLVGTLNGDLALADLSKAQGSDHPELTERIIEAHSGPIEIIERSKFFENLVLTIGGWTFKLWIDYKDTPIFVSSPSQKKYTSGAWSPTRAGVVVLGSVTGSVELWDLTEKTSEASLVTHIPSSSITSIAFSPEDKVDTTETKSSQFMAVGDAEGVMHLMAVPRSFRKPLRNERKLMTKLITTQILSIEDSERRKKAAADEAEEVSESKAENFMDIFDYSKFEQEAKERLGLAK